ncbi:hypothetical protein HDU76_006207 [Blyttiomyces sp. JEL0837]|nr:hypothetical protein HDU76_006207 [Blyttiomyces sp. JEL0837]
MSGIDTGSFGMHCFFRYLSQNQLSGSIPSSLGQLSNLVFLYLSSNQLSGDIPDAIGNLANLQYLYLSSNRLSGNIPDALSNLSNLLELGLSSNQLNGDIPNSLSKLQSLKHLSLDSNMLSGGIPDSVSNLSNLQDLYLSFNQFTGNITDSLGKLSNLVNLGLSSNQLSGSIPETLSNLRNLQKLYLQSNFLTGSIPTSLVTLPNLQLLNVTYNCLTGPPANNIQTFNFDPQSVSCQPSNVPPSTSPQQSNIVTTPTSKQNNTQPTGSADQNSGSKLPIIAGAAGGGFVVICILIVFGFLSWRRRQRQRDMDLKKSRDGDNPSEPFSPSSYAAMLKSTTGSNHSPVEDGFSNLKPQSSHFVDDVSSKRPFVSPTNTTQTFTSQPEPPQRGGSLSAKYWEAAGFTTPPSSTQSTISSPPRRVGTSNMNQETSYNAEDTYNSNKKIDKSTLFGGVVGGMMKEYGTSDDVKMGVPSDGQVGESVTERNVVERMLVRRFGLPVMWDHKQVMEWVKLKAFGSDVVKIFEDYKVDGGIVNSFVKDPNILKEDMGISNFVTRAKITQSVEIMQLEAGMLQTSLPGTTSWSRDSEILPPAYE